MPKKLFYLLSLIFVFVFLALLFNYGLNQAIESYAFDNDMFQVFN